MRSCASSAPLLLLLASCGSSPTPVTQVSLSPPPPADTAKAQAPSPPAPPAPEPPGVEVKAPAPCTLTPEEEAEQRRIALKHAAAFGTIGIVRAQVSTGPVALSGFRDLGKLVDTLEETRAQIEACYRGAQQNHWPARGGLTVRVEIDRCGRVVSASRSSPDTRSIHPKVVECVLQAYRESWFSPIEQDHHDVFTREHRFP